MFGRIFYSHLKGKVFMSQKLSHLLSACAVIMLLILSACGSTTSTPATSTTSNLGVLDPHKQYTVNFWEVFATGANKTALAALVKQYTDAHKNVKVNLQSYDSYGTLETKLNAAIAAKQPPAIAQVYESWATQYQQNGNIASLKPYIAGKNGLSQTDLSDFYGPLLKDGQINGEQYMLPFNKSDEVLYYNATLLKKNNLQPPTTLTEFVSDIKQLTKADGSQWGLSLTPSVDEWATIFKDLGGKNFVSADNQSALFDQGSDAQYAKQALDLLAPLSKTGALHVTTAYSWQNDFTSQKSAFALSTIASYPFIKEGVGSKFDFQEAAFPGGPAGQFTELYGTNLSLFSGVSDDTRNAAWDFLKFLTSTDANTSFVQQTGYMPIRQSVFNSQSLQSYYTQNPVRKVGPSQIPNTYVASAAPGWDKCSAEITNNYASVLGGHSDSITALQKMSQGCNSDLSQ
jgi:multiple sugar transport system substrate-binding protein